MWVHQINKKIFSHLYPDLLEDKEKFHGFFFFGMNIEQFYRLSQLVAEEIRKQNTNYSWEISSELSLLHRAFDSNSLIQEASTRKNK